MRRSPLEDFERIGGSGISAAAAQSATDATLAARLNLLTVGEEVMPREWATAEDRPVSGTVYFSYFTARKTETITKMQVGTSGTAATGTTLARIGVYSTNGTTLTLINASTNDTALWSATYTPYQKAFSASFSKVAGTRYAFALLFVGTGGATMECAPIRYQSADQAPRIQGELAAQADLPASQAESGLQTGYRRFQGIFLP